jgi:hypothetical protein
MGLAHEHGVETDALGLEFEALEPRLNAGEVMLIDLEGLTAVGVAGDAGQAVLAQLMSLSLRSGRIDVRSGEHDDHDNATAGAVWLCRPPASPESSRPAPPVIVALDPVSPL